MEADIRGSRPEERGPTNGEIVVQTANAERDFLENDWIGQILAIGAVVLLKISGSCPAA